MIDIIKKIVFGILLALFLWFFRTYYVHAGTDIVGGTASISQYNFVVGNNVYEKYNVQTGSYLIFLDPNLTVGSETTWFFDFGIDVPYVADGEYFEFSGYSNVSINVASANSLCENIANSSSSDMQYNVDNTLNYPTLIPFAFKCIYKPTNKLYVRLFGTSDVVLNTSGSSVGGFRLNPRLYFNKSIYVVKDASSTTNQLIQQQTIELEKQSDFQEEIKNFMTDTSTPDNSEYNFSSFNEDNGVITSLLTMPITLIQGMLNGMNNNCSAYVLGTIKGQTISLPCINVGQHLGIAWNIIDIIMSGIFIFVFGKKCITIFNDVTNMKSNQVDEVFK